MRLATPVARWPAAIRPKRAPASRPGHGGLQRTYWCRLGRGDDAVLDWLPISAVERVLAEVGVDLATLVPVVDAAVDGPEQTPGMAANRAA